MEGDAVLLAGRPGALLEYGVQCLPLTLQNRKDRAEEMHGALSAIPRSTGVEKRPSLAESAELGRIVAVCKTRCF